VESSPPSRCEGGWNPKQRFPLALRPNPESPRAKVVETWPRTGAQNPPQPESSTPVGRKSPCLGPPWPNHSAPAPGCLGWPRRRIVWWAFPRIPSGPWKRRFVRPALARPEGRGSCKPPFFWRAWVAGFVHGVQPWEQVKWLSSTTSSQVNRGSSRSGNSGVSSRLGGPAQVAGIVLNPLQVATFP